MTRKELEAWVGANRPDLALTEALGMKGFYKREAEPSSSFKGCGKTWTDVAMVLGAVEPPPDEPAVSARLDAIMRYYRAASSNEPPLTDVLQLRLEPDLKAWILANGGGAMIRDVMRTLKAEGEGKP